MTTPDNPAGGLTARGADADMAALVAWLKTPAAYPDAPRHVTMIETHLSCVFLTERHAYKLKKPVRFEFVDFSTRETRRRACQDEVRLNRRLADGAYLGVVEVTRDTAGRLRLGGQGEVVDWLVQMRRLPADRLLDQLILAQRLKLAEVHRLAELLAQFYQEASPVTLQADAYRAAVTRHVRANLQDLLAAGPPFLPEVVRRVHAAQFTFLELAAPLLDSRVCDGRIVEGHGDLRPEHVCLTDQPVIFDCLEFSAELRTLDVADELSFLDMECEVLGAPEVGQTVWQAYAQATGDPAPAALRAFYKSYRACVRAKVHALRAAQLSDGRQESLRALAGRYLDWADRYARVLGPPWLLVVRGLSGSGKTTLAEALAERLGYTHLETDRLRQELFGPSRSTTAPGPLPGDRYSAAGRERVYQEMFLRGERRLQAHQSAVLDGTFLTDDSVRRAAELAHRYGARWLIVECSCPAEVALSRIRARQQTGEGASEAGPAVFERQQAMLEALPAGLPTVTVETALGLQAQAEAVLCAMREQHTAMCAGSPDD